MTTRTNGRPMAGWPGMLQEMLRKVLQGMALAVLTLGSGGCMMVDLGSLLSSPELREIVVEPDVKSSKNKILLVDISGTLMDTDSRGFGDSFNTTPAYVKAVLNKAQSDRDIKAVVLRIDSGGGTVGASETIARELVLFRQHSGKPIYAQVTGLGCSGAYYLAAGANRIHAQPSAVVGSIGVIAILPKYRKLADKVGFETVVIKSGALKDMGNGMRDMTDEERSVFQDVIDTDYGQFIDWVLKHRPQIGDAAALKALADGRIYTSKQALDKKLIDQVAFLDETLQAVKTAAGLPYADVVTYAYRAPSEDANIYDPAASARALRLPEVPLPLSLTRPGFYYLWMPQ